MHQNKETFHGYIKAQLQELYIESGETTWHAIAKNGDVEIIRKKYFELDEREINFKDKAGQTPFAIAIEENNHEMVKELIKCGAKNSKKEMLNFLTTAIEKNNLEIVKELIRSGVEIPKEDMLKFLAISIKNQNSEMNIHLISIFNKKYNSEVGFKDVVVSQSSQEEKKLIYDAPSCEPSSTKKMKLSDCDSKTLS